MDSSLARLPHAVIAIARLLDAVMPSKTGVIPSCVSIYLSGDEWAALFDSFVTFNNSGTAVETYKAAGHQTCSEFARRVHGVPKGTWLHGMADARRQPGGAGIARMQKRAAHTAVGVDQMGNVSSTSEAIEWWKDLMLEWDKLPNESPPTIKYPPYVGEALYKEVYLPEMSMYSLAPPLKQKDDKAPGSWFRARQAAVNLLSLEEFGLKDGSTTAEPRLLFKLVARANHSNFPECTECRNNRMEKEQNIASRAPRDRRDATNAKQVAHVRECSDERAVTSAWVREASRSTKQAAATP